MPSVILTALGNGAVAALVLAACCALGLALVPARMQPPRRLHRLLFGLSAGSLAAGWLTWLVGTVSTRLVVPLALLLLAGAALGAGRVAASVRGSVRYLGALARANLPATALLAVLVVLLLPQLALPPVDSDGLRYHLALPKLYLLTGRVFLDPYSLGSTYPQGAEMLYLLGMKVADGGSAKLIHAGFFVAGLVALACLVHRDRETRPAALLAAAFLAASPVVLVPAAAAFVDHAALFHLVTALLLLSRGAGPLVVGIALAASAFTKITVAPVVVACWLVILVRSRRTGSWRALALAVAPTLLALAPLAARNLVATGDPFFPVGRVLLGIPTPGVPAAAVRYTTAFHADAPGPLGIAWGPDPVRTPPDEVAGWHLLLGLFAALVAVRRPQARILLVPVIAYALVGLWLHPPTRLLLPLLAALAALLATAFAAVHRRAARLAPLVALPAAYLGAHCVLTSFSPFTLLLGRLDRPSYLARTVPGYEAAVLVSSLQPRGRVMALDFPAPYYLDRPWIAEGALCDPPLLLRLRTARTAGDLLDELHALGVSHLLVTPRYGGGTADSLLLLAESRAQMEVLRPLRAALRLVATAGGVDIYEVPP